MLAYRYRNAGAVIHTHSPNAVMATLLWPGKVFRCTHLEMIKGIYDYQLKRNLRYDEELIVPIIENTPFEKDLEHEMGRAIKEYPGSQAVLVRRHGIYVWGDTWQKAKTMCVRSCSRNVLEINEGVLTFFQDRVLRLLVRPGRRDEEERIGPGEVLRQRQLNKFVAKLNPRADGPSINAREKANKKCPFNSLVIFCFIDFICGYFQRCFNQIIRPLCRDRNTP